MSLAQSSADIKRLSGPERAAILFLGLQQEQITKLMDHLNEDEIRTISRTMSRLGKVDPAIVEAVFNDFGDSAASGGVIVGTTQTTERLLRSVLIGRDELVDSILQEISGPPKSNTWERVTTVEAKTLADYLGNEHPQVAAVVLSQLFADYAAQVLAQLPQASAADIMLRLLEVSAVNREILDDIERALRNDLGMDLVQDKKKDPHNYMADLIGRVNSDTEARLLGSLESLSPEHAAMVRKHMFTFADLIKISTSSIQALLQECDKSRLAMALKLSDDSQRQKFLSNMSERQAKMFRDELESGGAPRKPEVEEAQKEIVLLAKALSAAGLLSLEPEEMPAEAAPAAATEEAPPTEAAAA
ncbi:MAG TPA: flagellar motor switch protein FliG [Candidatus Angelobacter sp.]|nr:flagellar motor switch protein FliG [Candidatus Angelobacter sp.]